MRNVIILILLFFFHYSCYANNNNIDNTNKNTKIVKLSVEESIKRLYTNLNTNGYQKPDFQLFNVSMMEFVNLNLDKKIITIIDYNLPIYENRLWVIDIKERKILYNTQVGHGINSGKEIPTIFSNKPSSYKSSIGRFITGEVYMSNIVGYALRIDGIDTIGPYRNDFVRDRGIVFHASAKNVGVTYSKGCPSLPRNIYKDIIETIKDGTFVYIYHNIFNH